MTELNELLAIEDRLNVILGQAESDAHVPAVYLRALRYIKTGENN